MDEELPVPVEEAEAPEPDWRLGGHPDPSIPGGPKPLGVAMSRADKVWSFRMRGVPVEQIAAHMGICKDTVYEDIRRYLEDYRRQIEEQPPINLIAEQMQFLDNMEAMCLHEANQTDVEDEMIDAATGRIIRRASVKKNGDKDKVSYLLTALKARDMKQKLLVETGLIPKDMQNMYKSLREQATPEDTDLRKDVNARSREDIMESIANLVKHGKRL
jgi:hypothetical protein